MRQSKYIQTWGKMFLMSEVIIDAVRSKYGQIAQSGMSGEQDGVRGVAEEFGYAQRVPLGDAL